MGIDMKKFALLARRWNGIGVGSGADMPMKALRRPAARFEPWMSLSAALS